MTHSSTFLQIQDAIENQRIVRALYAGKTRIMCPHAVGHSKSGVEMTLGYQFDGDSSSGGLPQWRCFVIERLDIISIDAGEWRTGTRKGIRDQPCVHDVIAEWRSDEF